MNIFKKISKDTGIPVEEIKEANNSQDLDDVNAIRFDIKNLEDARENFVFLTKMMQKSFIEWNELTLAELEKASTEDQITYVFENSPPESESYFEAFNKLVLIYNTIPKLTDFYFSFDTSSPEAIIILQKIFNLYKNKDIS